MCSASSHQGIHLIPIVEVPELWPITTETSVCHRKDEFGSITADFPIIAGKPASSQLEVIEGPGVFLHPVKRHTEICRRPVFEEPNVNRATCSVRTGRFWIFLWPAHKGAVCLAHDRLSFWRKTLEIGLNGGEVGQPLKLLLLIELTGRKRSHVEPKKILLKLHGTPSIVYLEIETERLQPLSGAENLPEHSFSQVHLLIFHKLHDPSIERKRDFVRHLDKPLAVVSDWNLSPITHSVRSQRNEPQILQSDLVNHDTPPYIVCECTRVTEPLPVTYGQTIH